MKKVTGWWFGTTDRKLQNGDGRRIKIGQTHHVDGEIIPCRHGLHLSRRIIDALTYSPGPVIYRVEGFGTVIPHGDPVDKYACSDRTYFAGGVDISDTLRKFARRCALDVIHLWDAPEVVVRYLKTGDESIRVAAWVAARDAARDAAGDAAWDAARAAWDAARDAARAAGVAARDAAGDAGWYATGIKQNRRLTAMVTNAIKTSERQMKGEKNGK